MHNEMPYFVFGFVCNILLSLIGVGTSKVIRLSAQQQTEIYRTMQIPKPMGDTSEEQARHDYPWPLGGLGTMPRGRYFIIAASSLLG